MRTGPYVPSYLVDIMPSMLKTSPVRAFSDNYIWLIHGRSTPSRVAIVDPGDASPVLAHVERHGLDPEAILVTHHHGDHVGGVAQLVRHFDIPVYGPAGERIPGRDFALQDGDHVRLERLDLDFEVLGCPGHTAGHIAYHGHGALFCGDTLFSAGCGRLFEGTPRQMTDSLTRLAALPTETHVYCAHEYTLSNLRFAATVEPDNQAVVDYTERANRLRAGQHPTLPSTLALEHEVNPFLRCAEPPVIAAAERHAGTHLNGEAKVFAELRAWKDAFA